ncbi:MAG: High-affnity carbon uptake protein Hat/HatR [Flammeovirgaceae bacterium]
MTQNHINILPSPFPGLRPFSTEETHLFFGREGQIDEVLEKMGAHNFVAILGTSGSGKSSFMFCGLIPSLHGGFMTQAGSNWQVTVMRPGFSPINNLAEAIARVNMADDANESDFFIAKSVNQAVLQSSSLGLVELINQNKKDNDTNYLILVDQFEEIFRFQDTKNEDHANEILAFVKLLTRAVEQTELPIYVVMTMRSDFIGDCAKFPQFTKMINDSHYLIPQMTREQKRMAILGPVAVGGGKMTSRLVQQLLNDLGDNPDQLPIMQHALMRTWDFWGRQHSKGEPIDIYHYEAIGGMEEALSQHANEAYEELNQEQQKLCERVFKCLTQKGEDGRGIRRPTKLKDICAITEAEPEEVMLVIDCFRKQGRTLLTPPIYVEIEDDTVVDISHESLMRIWGTLREWVQDESDSVKMYLRLCEAAAMFQEGKSGLWRPPDLQVAMAWKEKQQPNEAWAVRHDPSYERAAVFLKTSEEQYNAEQRAKLRAQKARLRRTRIIAVTLALATIISITFLVYAQIQTIQAEKNLENAKIQEEKAKKNAAEAEKQTALAEEQSKLAKEQEQIALNKTAEALESEKRAKASEKRAIDALAKAEEAAREAQKQKEKAELNATRAEDALALSEKNEKLAEEAKIRAEKGEEAAQKLRFKALAQTMAVKSLQLRDTAQKAIVAKQAFEFNKEYNSDELNSDVYAGLYDAQKLLEGEGFNSLRLGEDEGETSMNGGNGNAVQAIYFDKDNNIYTTGSDGIIKKWDLAQKMAMSLFTEQNINRDLKISDDGKYAIVATTGNQIKRYDLDNPNSGSEELYVHAGGVWEVEFTPDKSFVLSIGEDGKLRKGNIAGGGSRVFALPSSRLMSIEVDHIKNTLFGVTENGKILYWNLAEGTSEELLFEERNEQGKSIALSPDGQYIAVGFESGKVVVWDFQNDKIVQALTGHTAAIKSLNFSPDGKYLVTGSFDHTAQLWDLKSLNAPMVIFDDHTSWVWSTAFTPDSSMLLVGCSNGEIKYYPLNMVVIANQIENKVNRKLTKQEWEQFVGKDIEYPY